MSIILDVLNNKKFEKPPVWFMRQAGRHLPEYMNVRRRFSNLMEMFKDSDICAEITVQPVQRYNLDAAIIFTDILMIHMVTGADVSFDNIDGPKVIEAQKKTVDFNNIKFLYEAIKKTKSITNKPLIGFAGGPWTTLTYSLLNSTERKDPQKAIKEKEREIDLQVKEFTELTIKHALKQIDAGIDIFQLFESSAGMLNDEQLMKWCIEPSKEIFKEIKKFKEVPTIVFPRGVSLKNYITYSNIENLNCLSLDQFFDLKNINKLNPKKTLQGNLNPEILRNGGENLNNEILEILLAFKETPHIFNLGHGVIKDTPIKNVVQTLELIRS